MAVWMGRVMALLSCSTEKCSESAEVEVLNGTHYRVVLLRGPGQEGISVGQFEGAGGYQVKTVGVKRERFWPMR